MSIERKPLTKNSAIVLVSKAPSPDGRLGTRTGSGVLEKYKLPTLGIPPIHAALVRAGFKNVESIDTQFNYGGMLTADDWQRIENADVLMTTSITRNAPPISELIREKRHMSPKGTIFMGGFHVSAEKALIDTLSVQAGADVVVRGEGYRTVVEAMEKLINDGNVDGVKGTTHRKSHEIIREDRRPLLTIDELMNLPEYIYDPRVLTERDRDTIATSFGCPYSCNFCSVTDFYEGKYRRLPNNVIINSFKEILKRQPEKPIFIIDDNFFVNKEATKSLLKDMIDSGITLPYGSMIQVRESAGADLEFLQLARKAGITTLNVGIESINDAALVEMNKGTTSENIKKNIVNMRRAGFHVHGMFIVGLDADTKDSLRELLDWAKENVHTAQFFPTTPLPGTEDTLEKEKEGRILSRKYYLYDGTNVLIRPKNFAPWELQQIVIDMYNEFYSFKRLGYLNEDALPKKDSKYSYANLPKDIVGKMLATDAKVRAYANWTIKNILNEPARKEYFKALKNWKPGQTI